mmetsp:Transcript_56887/g.176461  ORF Transcript_56887/g.176461 Transcript_56887/m.176461 type:complete len:248 (-) Transcript_56887:46-789(-)
MGRVLHAGEHLRHLSLEEGGHEVAASKLLAPTHLALQPVEQQRAELRGVGLLERVDAGCRDEFAGVHGAAVTRSEESEDPLEGTDDDAVALHAEQALPEVDVEEQVLQQAVQVARRPQVLQSCRPPRRILALAPLAPELRVGILSQGLHQWRLALPDSALVVEIDDRERARKPNNVWVGCGRAALVPHRWPDATVLSRCQPVHRWHMHDPVEAGRAEECQPVGGLRSCPCRIGAAPRDWARVRLPLK